MREMKDQCNCEWISQKNILQVKTSYLLGKIFDENGKGKLFICLQTRALETKVARRVSFK